MTDGTTRREFLGSMAAFSLFPFEQEKSELILHNGHIVTMNLPSRLRKLSPYRAEDYSPWGKTQTR